MQMRVLRVISYEGNPDWVERVLARSPLNNRLRTLFRKQGTVSELQRVVLQDGDTSSFKITREENHAKGPAE